MTSVPSVRERVLGFVLRYPGAHPRAIERELGLSDRLAAHHLESLEAEGVLARLEDRGFARYVAAERERKLTAADRRFLALVRRAPALQAIVLLAKRGELPQREITRELGLAKASTSYHLRALRDAGIVEVRELGRERLYSIRDPPRTLALLADFPPIPGDLDAFSQMWKDLLG